jgi:D-beta-D-heptose 7-phosphate kinase/D-beta-D-heptose 1-phosphate adenosyltransferase
MNKLGELQILVIGDIMLDKYVIGDVERISPEAPVQVVDVTGEFCTLGGCGNVAKNLANLGVQVVCVAACGSGTEKDKLIQIMKEKGIQPNMVSCRKRITTVKERIVAADRSTHLLRIDRETREKVDPTVLATEIGHVVNTQLFKPDIILISDYNKGVITPSLMDMIQDVSEINKAKLIIDPKPSNKQCYSKAFAITPNHKEFEQMKELVDNPHFENIIVTKGPAGVSIIKSDTPGTVSIPAEKAEVFNVSGAGDSFVSIFSISIGMGIDVIQSTRIANKCSSYVVTKPGTIAVPYEIFRNAVLSIFPKGFFNGKEVVID